MPNNWSYVFGAYGLAAAVLLVYWRHLAGRAKALASRPSRGGA